MPKFEIPKITRTLEMGDYEPELAGKTIEVWVNPPKSYLARLNGLVDAARACREQWRQVMSLEAPQRREQAETLAERLNGLGAAQIEWFAEIWSQGPEDTRWTVEEVQALAEAALETDPALWRWLQTQTMALIDAHRAHVKKG